MKNVSPSFVAWLAANASCSRADLLQIVLPNGQTLRAAMGAMDDVSWGGNAYPASSNGVWTRGRVTSEAMRGDLKSNSVTLDVVAPSTVLFPGTSVPLSESFIVGAWDAATVTITTVYMPLGQWNTIEGSMVLFAGMISDARATGRSKGTLTAQDWLYLADQQVPKRVIQPGCFNTFGDTACGFNLPGIGINNTVGSGFAPTSIPPASAWPSTDARGNSISAQYNGVGYFANGKLIWTSGQNAGFYSHILSHGSNLILAAAPPFSIALGDSFTAFAGCQKTLADCKARWGNQANFAGFPFVPPPEHSV